MLVDKELVKKAKEKLGDDNFLLIMEALGIDDYNVKDKKCLCPFHNEKTPSFVYRPKSHLMHCYGCGKGVDLIDAYMSNGDTYIQAVKKLFDKNGMEYSFGEAGIKTIRSYKYPTEVALGNKDKVYEYFGSRKISPSTLDYFDVRQDEQGNGVFNFYDTNDVLTMVKYRPTHKIKKGETKTWCQKGADTAFILFNMNRINSTKPLLITEGEVDSMAAYESGYSNVVSVPLGSGNTQWIDYNLDWLEQFDTILIAGDNDTPGRELNNEVSRRLGTWRVRPVEVPQFFEKEDGEKIPISDLNEVLYFFGKEKLFEIISNAKEIPSPSLVDFADIEDIDLNDMGGFITGIEGIDKEVMKIFFGTVTLMTGTPGSGKTSFMNLLIANALEQSVKVYLYSREMPERMTRNWMNYTFAGARHINEYKDSTGAPYYLISKDVKKAIGEYYRGNLYFYKDSCSNDLEEIKTSMTDAVRQYGVRVMVLDNLTAINLSNATDDLNQKQTDFMNYLIGFARQYDVAIILLAHPRKMDASVNVGQYDISGSSNMINLAHRSFGLRRVSKAEKHGLPGKDGEWIKPPVEHDVIFSVIKDRFLGKNSFELPMYYDIKTRRFYTNSEEYGRQYSWDSIEYNDEIICPLDEIYPEVFGHNKERGGT